MRLRFVRPARFDLALVLSLAGAASLAACGGGSSAGGSGGGDLDSGSDGDDGSLGDGAAEASDDAIDALLAEGLKVSEVARRLAKSGLGDRHELYARAQERRGWTARGKGGGDCAEET